MKKKQADDRQYLEAIPLGRAAMCMCCFAIINSRNQTCPKCGGGHFRHLANWIKPMCTAEEIVGSAARL